MFNFNITLAQAWAAIEPSLYEGSMVLLGALLVPGYQLIKKRTLVNPNINFFAKYSPSPPTIVIPTLSNTEFEGAEYIEFTTPLESVLVLRTLMELYDQVFPGEESAKVYFSEAVPAEQLTGNLICIGGPIHNVVSRRLIEAIDIPFHFEEYDLVSDTTGRRYTSTIRDGAIVDEYALVAVGTNPWSHSKGGVLVLAGCRGFGAIGVSQFWASGDLIKQLKRRHAFKFGPRVAFIVHFSVQHISAGQTSFSHFEIIEFHDEGVN